VRARNSAGESDWSEIRNFKVQGPDAIRSGKNVPGLFALSGGSILHFELKRSERVTIRILDTRGRARVLVAGATYGPGPHRVALPDLPRDGVYLLDFRAGDSREIVKFLP
jgi:hypothetical protein